LEIRLHNFFYFSKWSYLDLMDVGFFYLSISTFNIGSVGNRTSYFFYLFFMRLFQSYNLGWGFHKLTQVNLGICFLLFFNIIYFFQFHSSILGWLGIDLHNLFWFSFYIVITILWHGSQIWQVNPGRSNIPLLNIWKKILYNISLYQ